MSTAVRPAGLVLDASATLAWCFIDERSPRTQALLDRVADEGALVPALWHLEIANILLSAERRQRATPAAVAEILDSLEQLPITTDQAPARQSRHDLLPLAREQALSVYDASYLDLAMRRRLPLATLDTGLQRAARAVGVDLIEL